MNRPGQAVTLARSGRPACPAGIGVDVASSSRSAIAWFSRWEKATALDPRDDLALQSFHHEGVRSLETFSLLRRVMAGAAASLTTRTPASDADRGAKKRPARSAGQH